MAISNQTCPTDGLKMRNQCFRRRGLQNNQELGGLKVCRRKGSTEKVKMLKAKNRCVIVIRPELE